MDRTKLELPTKFAFFVIGLFVMWQAVRFCQGLVPNFLDTVGLSEVDLPPFSIWNINLYIAYYICGIGAWLVLGTFIMILGDHLARIVAVGYTQYSTEQEASNKENRRLNEIEYRRAKRRELKRKLREKDITASGVILGVIIGSFFF